jgi:sigma-B regulation protein RsbU (phosphoserine phosphatase)
MRSAQEVAGDSYDFISIDEDHVGFAIADVAGKGIAAAMMASITHALLRTLASDLPDPAECIAKLNRLLTAHNPEMLFVTLVYGVLNRRTGVVSYANAGHPWPLRINASGAVSTLSGTTGIPLGIKEAAAWSTATMTLQRGDRLFLYTDGLTETGNAANEQFGEGRMIRQLQVLTSEEAEPLIHKLVATLDDFKGGASELDDITCLVLTWRGYGAEPGA